MNEATEHVCKLIADELFGKFPMAAFGPAHVCLEDGNYDYYKEAIGLCNLTLAHRALIELDCDDFAAELLYLHQVDEYVGICVRAEWYADHTTEEIAATLGALRLVEWHMNGCVGEAPE